MKPQFTHDLKDCAKKCVQKNADVMFISKAKEIDDSKFDEIVEIIDESGNEVVCTVEKFIEIFDNYGLEGFIL